MAKKSKMGLTPEQYNRLCHEAKALHDYWREWNRKLYEQAVRDGDLYEMVSTQGQRMQDEMDELIQQGLYPNEAHEIVWQEIYNGQNPSTEEKDPVQDFLEQYRKNALTMTDEELDAWVESYPD